MILSALLLGEKTPANKKLSKCLLSSSTETVMSGSGEAPQTDMSPGKLALGSWPLIWDPRATPKLSSILPHGDRLIPTSPTKTTTPRNTFCRWEPLLRQSLLTPKPPKLMLLGTLWESLLEGKCVKGAKPRTKRKEPTKSEPLLGAKSETS